MTDEHATGASNGTKLVWWLLAGVWAISMVLGGYILNANTNAVRDLAVEMGRMRIEVGKGSEINSNQQRALEDHERRLNKSPY